MEALKILKLPVEAMRYAGHQLLGGAFGELGDRYGEAVGGHLPHKLTIFPPVRPEPTPNGPHGSNLHTRLRDPVELGWELIEPREAA